MKVNVKLFARYREITGQREMALEIADGSTASRALDSLVTRYPALEPIARVSRCVVNQEYVAPDTPLHEGDEVAFLPPVSGGDRFTVTQEALDQEAVLAAVDDENAGAVVLFVGQARRFSRGKRVLHLEYECYSGMAEKKLAEIGAEIRRLWPVTGVAISHRVGHLAIGETSILIAVAAPHRDAAFESCRYAIEQIKKTVPVWKKEVWEDGEVWVGMEGG